MGDVEWGVGENGEGRGGEKVPGGGDGVGDCGVIQRTRIPF